MNPKPGAYYEAKVLLGLSALLPTLGLPLFALIYGLASRSGGRAMPVAELVARYQQPLYAFLYRQLGQAQPAEDLVQEVFVRLLTYRGDVPKRFRPWAFTIASNLARDYFRSVAFRREQVELDPEAAAAPQREPLDLAGPAAVAEALARLPAKQREVLLLRFYHALTLEEIADITGAPLGTVKSRLYHALRQMKALLAHAGLMSPYD